MTLPDIDTTKITDILRHVSATEVLPRFKNLAAGEIREKNPGDFVTVADEASEKALSSLLRDYLPASLVVGEEAVAKDESVLERLKGDEPVWVIDPIDGTYNFSHNRSKFGILLSLVHRGVTVYGFAYDVVGDRMAVAGKGQGAFLDGVRLKINTENRPINTLICQGGGAQAWHFDPVRPLFADVVNHRCSLHDFMDMYTGKSDCVIHVSKVTPWDHAANVLLAQECGASVIVGEEGQAYDPAYHGPAYLVAAPSSDIAHEIYIKTKPLLSRA